MLTILPVNYYNYYFKKIIQVKIDIVAAKPDIEFKCGLY